MMESLTGLVTAPLSVISQVVSGDPASSPAAAGPFDEDALQRLVYNLFQGDARVQQAALDEHYAEDVKFSDGLITLEGRDQLAKLLTGLTTLADLKPDIIELSIGPTRALILVNLRLAWRFLPWTFWRRLTVPLTINLTYTSSLMGGGTIKEHVHHMSHVSLLWWGQNPVADWLVARVWEPRSGVLLSLVEAATGALSGSWDHTFGRFFTERKAGASLMDASLAAVRSTTALLTSGRASVPPTPSRTPTNIPAKAAQLVPGWVSGGTAAAEAAADASNDAAGQHVQEAVAGHQVKEAAAVREGAQVAAAGGPAGAKYPAMTPLSDIPVATVSASD